MLLNRKTKLPCLLFAMALASLRAARVEVDLSQYRSDSGITAAVKNRDALQITWPTSKTVRGEMMIDLRPDQPLIQSLGLAEGRRPAKVIATKLDPVATLTIGERDRQKFEEAFRGMVFFENPRQKPYE